MPGKERDHPTLAPLMGGNLNLKLVRAQWDEVWNTVYPERAIDALRGHGIAIGNETLARLSPIGREHINLTGDYTWQAAGRLRKGSFRPLRPFSASNAAIQTP